MKMLGYMQTYDLVHADESSVCVACACVLQTNGVFVVPGANQWRGVVFMAGVCYSWHCKLLLKNGW